MRVRSMYVYHLPRMIQALQVGPLVTLVDCLLTALLSKHATCATKMLMRMPTGETAADIAVPFTKPAAGSS